MSERFDLVVIGSGPGGMRAAVQAAKVGKRVAIVDRDGAGGGCVYFGTVPSKALREAALGGQPFAKAMAHMRSVVKAESRVVGHQLERNGVKFFRGEAHFSASHEVTVRQPKGKVELRGESIVVATGTSPIPRPEYQLRGAPIYDSDTVLSLKSLPKRLLILGAGVIGCEYASIFARLGSTVTLADRREELLRAVDLEAVTTLQEEFRAAGVQVHLGAEFGAPERNQSGGKLRMKLGRKTWKGDAILVCLGRQANTAGLGLREVGVELDDRGQIRVHPGTYRTNLPHISAVGDVIGPPALAAASAEQGRIAASHILGLECEKFPASFPAGIYTIPEISSFGALEADLTQQNVPFVVGRAYFRELARGLIVGAETGFIKLLVHQETRQILGAHAVGLGASELIHIGQMTHALQAPVEFLVQNIFNYPTFAEAYKVAALNALNQIRAANKKKP